jgi:UDP-glucose 4-epimerase
VRSTLIYGEGDPHNGHGPNRFRRLAAAGQEIVLFGEGEERRVTCWSMTWPKSSAA